MARILVVKGGEVRRTVAGQWRSACCACDMGALFDIEEEAADAMREHLREYHGQQQSAPSCPECGAAVYYDLTCHTWPSTKADGGVTWMSCMPCDSATYYGCVGEGCRWSYTHRLNPQNPRAVANEAKRPPWLDEGLAPLVPFLDDVEWPDA